MAKAINESALECSVSRENATLTLNIGKVGVFTLTEKQPMPKQRTEAQQRAYDRLEKAKALPDRQLPAKRIRDVARHEGEYSKEERSAASVVAQRQQLVAEAEYYRAVEKNAAFGLPPQANRKQRRAAASSAGGTGRSLRGMKTNMTRQRQS